MYSKIDKTKKKEENKKKEEERIKILIEIEKYRFQECHGGC